MKPPPLALVVSTDVRLPTPDRQDVSVKRKQGAARLRTRFLPPRFGAGVALIPAATIVVLFALFTAWTILISFTGSRLLPNYDLVGTAQYVRLFASLRWWTGMENLAIYAVCLIGGCLALGYLLAVLIDHGKRWEAIYRTIFLLPLSLSFVVTGIVWHWLLSPDLGFQAGVRALGWSGFTFDWLVRPDLAIYTIAIAGIWQHAGMCMVLFLAGLRGLDQNVWRAARLDGVPVWRTYLSVVTPMLRPAFFTATVLLFATAAKSYDLVVALTDGGPGFSSDLPARFVIEMLGRQELGMGAAGACMLLFTIAAVFAPYLYVEMRRQKVST